MESSGSFFFQILNQIDIFLHRLFGGLALKLIPGIVLGSAFKIGKSRAGPAHISFGTLFVKAVKLSRTSLGGLLGSFVARSAASLKSSSIGMFILFGYKGTKKE